MKKNPMKRFTITIPTSQFEQIEKLKEISAWNRSLIIREALKDFLKRYGPILETT